MDSRARILQGIQDGQMLFRSGNAFSRFYPIDDGQKVAKVFISASPFVEAEKEYQNLQTLQTLDARIRVPTPYEVLEVGQRQALMAKGLEAYGIGDEAIYAVVMEWIHGYGPSIAQLPRQDRSLYKPSLDALLDALQEHRLSFKDIKSDHLICMQNSSRVCLVDTHLMAVKPGALAPDEYHWLRRYLDPGFPSVPP